jgi:hypothetical protein
MGGNGITIAEYIKFLKTLPQDRIAAVMTCDGVYLLRPRADLKLARWHNNDHYIFVDYFPCAEQEAEDDELYGPRRAVAILS